MHRTIYQMHGYADRHEYFKSLADSYCTDVTTVNQMSNSLGIAEDFGGLPRSLEAYNGESCGE